MNYAAEYFGEFEPETELYALAQQYHNRCEAYDRTVCSGPIGRDGILPANYQQAGLINRHASGVWKELAREAEKAGYSRQDFQRAISRTNFSAGG